MLMPEEIAHILLLAYGHHLLGNFAGTSPTQRGASHDDWSCANSPYEMWNMSFNFFWAGNPSASRSSLLGTPVRRLQSIDGSLVTFMQTLLRRHLQFYVRRCRRRSVSFRGKRRVKTPVLSETRKQGTSVGVPCMSWAL